MMRRVLAVLVFGLVAGCMSGTYQQHYTPPPPFLRVGVTPDSPPYVFRENDQYRGAEIDFARRLATALGRQLALVPTAWDEQIPSLLAGYTDVIMSGMSITSARAARVAFSSSYLTTHLGAVVRREDAQRWPTAEALLQTSPRIGVRVGTTGEALVRARRPDENIVSYRRSRDAIWELLNYRIDVYVTDLPIIQSAVRSHPGKLVAYPRVVGQQSLAWAFRPTDGALVREVNEILEQWRSDGTLMTVLGSWPSLNE